MPYDVIIGESIIGTEMGGWPGSTVVALQRLPLAGEPDAAVIVVDVPDDVTISYQSD